jgi:hypothetical protein
VLYVVKSPEPRQAFADIHEQPLGAKTSEGSFLIFGATIFQRWQRPGPASSQAILERAARRADGSDGACTNDTARLEERKTNTLRHTTSVVGKNIVRQPCSNRGICSIQFCAYRHLLTLRSAGPGRHAAHDRNDKETLISFSGMAPSTHPRDAN